LFTPVTQLVYVHPSDYPGFAGGAAEHFYKPEAVHDTQPTGSKSNVTHNAAMFITAYKPQWLMIMKYNNIMNMLNLQHLKNKTTQHT